MLPHTGNKLENKQQLCSQNKALENMLLKAEKTTFFGIILDRSQGNSVEYNLLFSSVIRATKKILKIFELQSRKTGALSTGGRRKGLTQP